jgi:branched-chain amino acid transport system ATP-binding protein
MSEAFLLEANGLTMRFGGVVAVDNVDFKLRYGELRCLIGPNGAGKSTFFKMLCGQLKPSSGDVRLKGKSLLGLPAARIARLGMGIKTQVPSVFDGMTVEESVQLASDRVLPTQLARERTQATLDRIGIADLKSRPVGKLAHGQRQLVELAMVIAPEPDLIILDEPAAGMTGDEVTQLGDLVVELARSSSVIVVEHDMQFIRRIARTVTVFNRGKVLIEGPADTVMEDQLVRDVYLGKDA